MARPRKEQPHWEIEDEERASATEAEPGEQHIPDEDKPKPVENWMDPFREKPAPEAVKARQAEIEEKLRFILDNGAPGRLALIKKSLLKYKFEPDDFYLHFHYKVRSSRIDDHGNSVPKTFTREGGINIDPITPIQEIMNGIAGQLTGIL